MAMFFGSDSGSPAASGILCLAPPAAPPHVARKYHGIVNLHGGMHSLVMWHQASDVLGLV